MPVTIEEIIQPSSQDRDDLQKIYEDAPSWMLDNWRSTDHSSAIARLLDTVAQTEDQHLYAARFNHRLLGALIVDKQNDRWLIHHLCVRQLTRGRGVGSRLLRVVTQKALTKGKAITLYNPVIR
ncbi:acetyl-CoA sensor PanZ family protein [Candidatus Sororendozoicomonas aggregata]|uniref:acetyl-CoA sensor PanZ family protein n=1 Tax=Candidatus Sororendozoicomonas aggregata TaxID=3073239 RepID=UPI002ED3EBBD